MAIKNVFKEQLKRCVFLTDDEFKRILRQYDIEPEYSYDGITYIDVKNQDDIANEDVCEMLSEYFNTKVTSIHIDDCEYVGVWVAYREEFNLKNFLYERGTDINYVLERIGLTIKENSVVLKNGVISVKKFKDALESLIKKELNNGIRPEEALSNVLNKKSEWLLNLSYNNELEDF